ncbi:tRNA guanosine(15) transglycosylase TgtA [Candidatus Bathyarchaeota archaeon]|nr:tRNA guanosine(15) transglycosylase TgtA [Candidatus Bathyarchaeota archaeon]
MSFELRDRDLLGRIGRLRTKGGEVETPAFMPVINPVLQTLAPKRMKKEFGCDIVITNSYIIKRRFGDIPDLKVHDLLDYDGVVMTDSGAYQILVYGGVEISQPEIIEWQKSIGSDIAVILDIPTGWDVPREDVEYTVEETLRRAEAALPLVEDSDALWVGPIQGGRHLDLVATSAKRIGKMPYDIHALGSPTEVMERYMYPVLVDMTMTAKLNIPPERPLHLFGAGHPMIFAMSVAMGCDLFDSAAYVLYAKDDRYLTNRGTSQLKDLQYLPCNCPVCSSHSAEEIKSMPKGERQRLLTEHNLHATMTEINVVKQAIVEGGLWDLVEARANGHPQMTSAIRRLAAYREHLEEGSHGFKGRGVFFYDYHSLAKPEVTRYTRQLKENYGRPEGKTTLLLLPCPPQKPFNTYPGYLKLKAGLKGKVDEVHICFYAAPYGAVPEPLSETYPLSQYEIAEPLDHETVEFTLEKTMEYIKALGHTRVILIRGDQALDNRLEETLRQNKENLVTLKPQSLWEQETGEQVSQLI